MKPRPIKDAKGRSVSRARLTSFHEAGHCVVGNALGLPIAKALLEGEHAAEGFVEHTAALDWLTDWVAAYVDTRAVARFVTLRRRSLSRDQRQQVRAYLVMCCAGYVSESIVLRRAPSPGWSTYSDRDNAEGAARLLGISPKPAIRAAKRKAREILFENAHRVAAVARELRRTVPRSARDWRLIKRLELLRVVRAADGAEDRRVAQLVKRGVSSVREPRVRA